MKETVSKYIKAGLSCLPTQKDKSPKKWLKWKEVDVDLKEFNQYGIGIKCGFSSNGLECLDFDNHFGDAKKIFSDYLSIPEVRQIYENYKLPIQSTLTGGYHLLYRCEKVDGNEKLASRPKWSEKEKKWKPDAIIETRGEGGYFVAAPTPGYKIIRNDILDIQEITKEERKILIDNAISFNEWVDHNTLKKNEYEDKDRPGDYYNEHPDSISDMTNCLLKHGWKQIGKFNWCRPGKKTGVSATLGKVDKNVFYVFSSNAYPFDPMHGYMPFQVICMLDYNSDFKSFAKELADKYQLSTPDTYQKKKTEKPKEKEKSVAEKDELLAKRYIDVTIPVEKPPVIMMINHGNRVSERWKRLMTLGNFSCVIGKSKSKKTFLMTKLISTFGMNYYDSNYKFQSDLPEKKRMILHFDTEQSGYDGYVTAKRIHDMAGEVMENVATWDLREDKPSDRFMIIEHAVEKFKDNIGVVFIDGIADIVHTINSEELANEVLYKLMRWTTVYNIHICIVIHQNKNDNWASGWLGTQIMKKAELVISSEKCAESEDYSKISCEMIRGVKDFKPFYMVIDELGLPEITDEFKVTQLDTLDDVPY